MLITGIGFTVTVTGVSCEGQPAFMFQLIVPLPFPLPTPGVVDPPTTPPINEEPPPPPADQPWP